MVDLHLVSGTTTFDGSVSSHPLFDYSTAVLFQEIQALQFDYDQQMVSTYGLVPFMLLVPTATFAFGAYNVVGPLFGQQFSLIALLLFVITACADLMIYGEQRKGTKLRRHLADQIMLRYDELISRAERN